MRTSDRVSVFGRGRRLLIVVLMASAMVTTLAGSHTAPTTGLTMNLATAGGCTGFWGPASECGTVYGSNHYVSGVRANFAWDGPSSYKCGRQMVTANSVVIDYSSWMCVSIGTSMTHTFNWRASSHPLGFWFRSGTVICVYFSPYSGLKACETVY